jgi:hypothetical protein
MVRNRKPSWSLARAPDVAPTTMAAARAILVFVSIVYLLFVVGLKLSSTE